MAYAKSNFQNAIGIPGLLWLTLRDMSHDPGTLQKALDQTDWVYDFTAGLISTKSAEQETAGDWEDRLEKILNDLDKAEHDYNPLWENPDFSQDEADYRRKLKSIRRKLIFLIIDAKLVDREYQRMQEAPNPLDGAE